MSKTEDNLDMKVLKKASCKSLSGKSSLTYELAQDQDNEIHVRIIKNTGGGFYSPEFVSLGDIRAVMEEHPAGTPVTSFLLQPLFHGKSVNTPAFLLAALAHEKLLCPMKGKKRSLEPAEDFTKKVTKLMASKGTAGTAPKKTASRTTKKTVSRKTGGTVSKKVAVKKKAAARKKTV